MNVSPEDAFHLRVAVQNSEKIFRVFEHHLVHPGAADRHGVVVQKHQDGLFPAGL